MSSNLRNRRILLGVCGGIAAYKSAELARRLQEAGAEVRVVMTNAAQHFITPLTFQALTGNPVHYDLFDTHAEAAMSHIELARWADLLLVAPATANRIADLAQGVAYDLLTTLYLATEAKIAIAPAMNQKMWEHPATQQNLTVLHQRGVHSIGPASGLQACGEVGWGRLLEPEQIIEQITLLFSTQHLSNKTVLITAGPTREAIDPIRYMTNHSSGKMGFALAQAAYDAGANVILIAGPVDLIPPHGVEIIFVQTALEMHQSVIQQVEKSDIFIAAAAVSDYRCQHIMPEKIKKSVDRLTLELVRNPDIISEIAALKNKPYTVGFAAETHSVIEYAKEKLTRKGLDMIIANQVGITGQGFGSDNNQVTIITSQTELNLALESKRNLAKKIMDIIANQYQGNDS